MPPPFPPRPLPLDPSYDVIGGEGASFFINTKSFIYIFTVLLSVLKQTVTSSEPAPYDVIDRGGADI